MRYMFALAVMSTLVLSNGAARAHERKLVRYGGVQIDTIVDGAGPAIVLLPSLARDSEDFDAVATALADRGFAVLRPQPRGMGASKGPLVGVTLHDFARDVAEVIAQLGGGRAVIAGHAYGNWVARMTAVDFPGRVRGVAILAAAAKQYDPSLSEEIAKAGNPALPQEIRLQALRIAFFAPGNDPRVWLTGWHPELRTVERAAAAAVKQDVWWGAGHAPLLEVQADADPFKPVDKRGELKAEFGARVSVVMIAHASHALIPEQPQAVAKALADWSRRLPP